MLLTPETQEHNNSERMTSGAMVAIYPSSDDLSYLSAAVDQLLAAVPVEDRVPVSEYHITLAYFGEVSDIVGVAERIAEVTRAVSESLSPIPYNLNGAARFLKVQDDGSTPVVLLIDSQDMRLAQESLTNVLFENGIPYSREHDFTPHITIAYLRGDVTLPEITLNAQMVATSLCLKVGESKKIFPLGGEQVMSDYDILSRGDRAAAGIDFTQYTPQQLLDNPDLPVPFVASTEGMKRDGQNLKIADWDLSRYRTYGPVLWIHDPRHPTIGRGDATLSDKLRISVFFDKFDQFAQLIRRKAIQGMMAGSVGWDKVRNRATGAVKNLLVEFSMTPLGVDEDSLPELSGARMDYARFDEVVKTIILQEGSDLKSYRITIEPETRGEILPHQSEMADETEAWDTSHVSGLSGRDVLRRSFALHYGGDPDNGLNYRFPHHMADGRANWRGVAAAMAELDSCPDLTEWQYESAYRHLIAHYEQFRKNEPKRATVVSEWRSGEAEIVPSLKQRIDVEANAEIQSVSDGISEIKNLLREIAKAWEQEDRPMEPEVSDMGEEKMKRLSAEQEQRLSDILANLS